VRRRFRIGRAIRLVWSVAPLWTLITGLLAVVQGLLPLASLYLLKLIVDSVTALASGSPEAAAGPGASLHGVWGLIVAAGAVAVATTGARLLSGLAAEALSLRVSDHVTDVLHAKSIEVDLEYYENPAYFDLLHRAQAEAPYRPVQVVNDLILSLQTLVSLVGVMALLVSLNWLVAVVVAVAALPGVFVRARHSGRLFRWRTETARPERLAEYLNWLITGRDAAKEVRLLNLGDVLRGRHRDVRAQLRRERLRLTRRRSTAEAGAEAVALIAVFAVLGYVATLTVNGSLTLGAMVMYFSAVQVGSSSLRSVLNGLASLHEHNLFLATFEEFLQLEPRLTAPEHPEPFPRPLTGGVRFEAITFAYPGSERQALSHTDLALEAGRVTALVGPNGCGKTTLVKLLCRLYDPDAGRVLVDGHDLREFDVLDLRRNISVVFQDYVQYALSARDNIWVGDTRLEPHDEQIIAAAQAAGAHDVIANLPGGYDTILGRWVEDGEELSTGEWQRVALARAFLPEAGILVLDEPTASLDPDAEAAAFAEIRRLAEGRAVLLITHRYSTVGVADHIYVMDEGRVVESGSHAELLASGGFYARMFRLQAGSQPRSKGD
jgi:ATP-binding cassette subfamily B protein